MTTTNTTADTTTADTDNVPDSDAEMGEDVAVIVVNDASGPRVSPARILLVAALVLLALFTVYETARRFEARSQVHLDAVQLTARTALVAAPGEGTVVDVPVEVGQPVGEGLPVATVEVEDTSYGWSVTRTVELLAPADGEVHQLPGSPGQNVSTGDVIVGIYDPDTLHFLAPIDTGTLSLLRTGMDVVVTLPTGMEVAGTLGRAVPRFDLVVDRPDADRDRIYVAIEPDDPERLAGSVPGIVVTAVIDTGTAPDGTEFLAGDR